MTQGKYGFGGYMIDAEPKDQPRMTPDEIRRANEYVGAIVDSVRDVQQRFRDDPQLEKRLRRQLQVEPSPK